MATMKWPDIIGDDRYTKRFIDELDGSGNQVYVGKAPVVNASVNDDGWFIRKQWFDGSNKLLGYQEFTGIWSQRATYYFGPNVTVRVNPLRVVGTVVASPKKFKYAKAFAKLQLSVKIRPIPTSFVNVFGQVTMRCVNKAGKNWSTVTTKTRRASATCGVVYGRARAFKIKTRKTVSALRMSAKVVATK